MTSSPETVELVIEQETELGSSPEPPKNQDPQDLLGQFLRDPIGWFLGTVLLAVTAAFGIFIVLLILEGLMNLIQ